MDFWRTLVPVHHRLFSLSLLLIILIDILDGAVELGADWRKWVQYIHYNDQDELELNTNLSQLKKLMPRNHERKDGWIVCEVSAQPVTGNVSEMYPQPRHQSPS